jgi:hypothetical protein
VVRRCVVLSLFLGAVLVLVGCSGGEIKVEVKDAKVTAGKDKEDEGYEWKDMGNGVKVKVKKGTAGPKGTTGDFEQTGAFPTFKEATGEVYFPLPYKEAPAVELKPKFPQPHDVELVELKATGFKWQNKGKRKGVDEPTMVFTARGIPVPGQEQKPFEQTGDFKADSKASGVLTFPQAYAAPPHIELAAKFGIHDVVITKTTAEGFHWTNRGQRDFVDNAEVTYTARGVKK